MQLPVEFYPIPYMISWIKDVQLVKVIARYFVPLQMGKYYTDNIVYDNMEKDACHILFGRP